ncbi:MAG: phosphoenolpyruvate carboxylase [Candidatus Woesearchaeota archaeon]
MSIRELKEGVCISADRMMPATVATQFPDNVERPFWSFKDAITVADDFFDCYVSFKDLYCQEYFWDWQGRKLDELLLQKLVGAYSKFFKARPIGKDHFLTLNVRDGEALEQMGKIYMSIITSNDFAQGQKMASPPLFEVVHSAKSAEDLTRFANLYNETVSMASEQLDHDCGPKVLSILPTHQFGETVNWYSKLNGFFTAFQSAFRCRMDYFRPVIPRAAIADELGFIASTLATKRAISSYHSFSKITGVAAYPVIDAGPLLFRGGLAPDNVRPFLSNYPGISTVTITSSFRFDNDLQEVRKSIAVLNKEMKRKEFTPSSRDELKGMLAIERIFSRNYKEALEALPSLDDLSGMLNKINIRAGKNIGRSFALYSLGVPPEFLGTGRALIECIREGVVNELEDYYPGIKQDLIRAGSLLNKENLRFLAKTDKGWKSVLNDVALVEDYVDATLGPTSTDGFLHRNHTSNVFHLSSTKKDISADILAAAKARHCLG